MKHFILGLLLVLVSPAPAQVYVSQQRDRQADIEAWRALPRFARRLTDPPVPESFTCPSEPYAVCEFQTAGGRRCLFDYPEGAAFATRRGGTVQISTGIDLNCIHQDNPSIIDHYHLAYPKSQIWRQARAKGATRRAPDAYPAATESPGRGGLFCRLFGHHCY